MKARKVHESINFKRGEDPYDSLDVGNSKFSISLEVYHDHRDGEGYIIDWSPEKQFRLLKKILKDTKLNKYVVDMVPYDNGDFFIDNDMEFYTAKLNIKWSDFDSFYESVLLEEGYITVLDWQINSEDDENRNPNSEIYFNKEEAKNRTKSSRVL